MFRQVVLKRFLWVSIYCSCCFNRCSPMLGAGVACRCHGVRLGLSTYVLKSLDSRTVLPMALYPRLELGQL